MQHNLFYNFFSHLKKFFFSLVGSPHGVRGYLIDFVRPPWGWSTGFIATPRTQGLSPCLRQKPDFVFDKFFFCLK